MTAMDHSNAITLYDNAKYWVAQYESVDELKDFIDKAAAIKEYARRACDFELEKKAAKARIRAERRIGELLAMTEKARGGDRRSTSHASEVDSEYQRVCSSVGISKDQSFRFQKLAAIVGKHAKTQANEGIMAHCCPTPSVSMRCAGSWF